MEFKKDKLAIIFLIILLVLGTYLRFTDYDAIGYSSDSLLTVVGGLAWFYPHSYFPGLIYISPPLGNMIVGSSCMLSGEDFSGVSKVTPKFTPNIPILVGDQVKNAEPYCKFPIYLFGTILLIVLSLLAISLLKDYTSLYPIAFFTFSSFLLYWGRFISINIISFAFIFLGLFFLWRAYDHEKKSKKENQYFLLSFLFLGFAGAIKLSSGIYPIFAFILLLEKYKDETKLIFKRLLKTIKLKISEKIEVKEEVDIKQFFKKIGIYIIVYIFALLLPFKLNIKNFIDIVNGYNEIAPEFSGISLGLKNLSVIHEFLLQINLFDFLIFIFSIFVFIKLLSKKDKQKNEKFIFYFVILFIFTLIFFESTRLFRVAIPLLISIIFLMGLSFSNSEYSIFNLFKIPIEKRKKLFFIFLTIYILFSCLITFQNAPYYTRGNDIVCLFEEKNCDLMVTKSIYGFSIKPTVNFLDSIMNENETFLFLESVEPNIYSRKADGWLHFQFFDMNVDKKLGRYATLEEKVRYFHPEERNIRYYVPTRWYYTETDELSNYYKPNYIIKLGNKDAAIIYDLYNLTKK